MTSIADYIKSRFFIRLTFTVCLMTLIILIFVKFFDLTDEALVPNRVHYVIFHNRALDFTPFLSLVSVLKNHKPESIFIHTNSSETLCQGRYWNSIKSLANYLNVALETKPYDVPTHVYGQKLSSVYHSSDVARLSVLYSQGGIYLDTDVVVLKPLNEFLYYETTLACPDNIGNQIIIAARGSKFIGFWIESYRNYQPTRWYTNAGDNPTKILERNPELVNKLTTEFGVQNLLERLYVDENWKGWKSLYSVHLLSRHDPAPKYVNETLLYKNAYGEIIHRLLYQIEPMLEPNSLSWQFT